MFWDSHMPTGPIMSQQYKSMILVHDDEQRRLATETRDSQEARIGAKLYTQISEYSEFYLAEDYHQKYRLRGVPALLQDLQRIYPHNREFFDSTAAARVNGYVSGYGTLERLQSELSALGLSPADSQTLLDIVGARPGRKAECPLSTPS